MYNRFVKELRQSGMAALLHTHGAVLVGYSGGADSTLLLHYLYRYTNENGQKLYAVHVHHGIRGAEADRDEMHCRAVCAALHVPLQVYHRNIPHLAAERSMGLEECARAERYVCFDEAAHTVGMPEMPIATAHNGDDQLETVLFHLLRGSGLSGMCGISPLRDERFLRPLLSFSSAEIRETCQKEGYTYVEDSTNTDTTYTRNYLRHEILPRLRHVQPHPENAATRMTNALTLDNDYLTQTAAEEYKKCRIGQNGINRLCLCQMHPAIGKRVLRLAYEAATASDTAQTSAAMTYEQTEILWQMVNATDQGKRCLSLHGHITSTVQQDTVYFCGETHPQHVPFPTCVTNIEQSSLTPEKTVIFDWMGGKIVLSRKKFPPNTENLENIYNLSIQHPINFAKIKGVLCLRTRMPGDTIVYRGVSRRVRKLQNELHVANRDKTALLTDENGIVWIEGIGTADRARTTPDTDDILWIEVYTPKIDNI